MGDNSGTNRYNFWSSFNAQPKSKYKFLVRFGNNIVFKSDNNVDLSNSLNNFKDLKSIPNSSWLVKSVTRPVFTTKAASKDKFYMPDGKIFGIQALTPEDFGYAEMSIKFVNIGSHFFHPKEMPQDLDFMLSKLVREAGYSYNEKERKKVLTYSGTAYDAVNATSENATAQPTSSETSGFVVADSPEAAMNATQKQATTSTDAFRESQRRLLEPFQIIDLSTDFLPDYDVAKFKDTRENTYIPEFANPLSKYDVYVEGSKTSAVISPLRDARVYPLGRWKIYNPMIVQISFGGDNAYENDNQFLEYELKIGFDWAEYESYINLDPAAKYNNIY